MFCSLSLEAQMVCMREREREERRARERERERGNNNVISPIYHSVVVKNVYNIDFFFFFFPSPLFICLSLSLQHTISKHFFFFTIINPMHHSSSESSSSPNHRLDFSHSEILRLMRDPLDDAWCACFFVTANKFHLSSARLFLCSSVSQIWKEAREAASRWNEEEEEKERHNYSWSSYFNEMQA